MQEAIFEKTNEQMMNNTKELIKIFTAAEIKEIKKTQEHSQQVIE